MTTFEAGGAVARESEQAWKVGALARATGLTVRALHCTTVGALGRGADQHDHHRGRRPPPHRRPPPGRTFMILTV